MLVYAVSSVLAFRVSLLVLVMMTVVLLLFEQVLLPRKQEKVFWPATRRPLYDYAVVLVADLVTAAFPLLTALVSW